MTTHTLQAMKLGEISKVLQALHKHLLWFQANQVGCTGSPLQLFDRATKDTAFEWLKPLRDSIVALDTRMADQEPMSASEAQAFGDRFRELLDADSGQFREKLNIAFQSDPEVIWAMRAARKSLGAMN